MSCATGQKPAFTAFITARVKAIAVAVGAPVSALESCTPNIQIIFTIAPQELPDQVRKDDPDYLGYAETSALREKLATVSHPIQPSVVNILASECDGKVAGITAVDLAYLNGLYRMASDKSPLFQQNDITDRMKVALDHGAATEGRVNLSGR